MKVIATIRRWTDRGWGIANAYPNARYFVHVNHAVSEEVQLALGSGVRIAFEVGEPRNSGELPAALQIELASPVKSAVAPTNTSPAPVEPKPTQSGDGGGQ